MVDEKLLSILACPGCKGTVGEEEGFIICRQCGRQYPVRDGIPIMLLSESHAADGQDSSQGGPDVK